MCVYLLAREVDIRYHDANGRDREVATAVAVEFSVVSNTLVKSVRWSTSAMLKSAEIWKFAPTSPVMLMSGILMEPSVPLFQAMFKPLGKEITASTATHVSVL